MECGGKESSERGQGAPAVAPIRELILCSSVVFILRGDADQHRKAQDAQRPAHCRSALSEYHCVHYCARRTQQRSAGAASTQHAATCSPAPTLRACSLPDRRYSTYRAAARITMHHACRVYAPLPPEPCALHMFRHQSNFLCAPQSVSRKLLETDWRAIFSGKSLPETSTCPTRAGRQLYELDSRRNSYC